jgi:transglutaminase-like putative cysteine protease
VAHVFLPARRTRFENIWPGVFFTLVAWTLLAAVFSFYLRSFASYSSYYAGLAGIVASLYFMYLAALVLILGGEFNRALRIRRLARPCPPQGRHWLERQSLDTGRPARDRAICDFVHGHIAFDYANADPLRTAYGGFVDRTGVCRDFAHLAITLCRCMNIPARYCTGYLGDIGVPADPNPMDFSGWFEAYLGGHWYTFDARHNKPRIGRLLMATGRDATDVAISTSFGTSNLVHFEVITEEVPTGAVSTAG